MGAKIKEKLSANPNLEKEKNLHPTDVFSNEERASIKEQAFEKVKEKLEPKELDVNNRKISPEAGRQAFITYKQLERASHLLQTNGDQTKVTEAFSNLDREAGTLNQIRRDYNRREKTELLREGIKTDLIDWFKRSSDGKQNISESQIGKILLQNFKQSDFRQLIADQEQISVLSRRITEKVEAKQLLATKDKEMPAISRESINQAKSHFLPPNEHSMSNAMEKGKEAPILTR